MYLFQNSRSIRGQLKAFQVKANGLRGTVWGSTEVKSCGHFHLLVTTSTKITFSLMDTNYKYSTFKQILDLRSILRSISFVSITHTTSRSNRGPIFWSRSRGSIFKEIAIIYASSSVLVDGYMQTRNSGD